MTLSKDAAKSDIDAESPLHAALAAVKRMIPLVGDRLPRWGAGSGDRYAFCEKDDWVEGFWPGQLWLGYALTGDDAYRAAAEAYRPYFAGRLDRPQGYTHDMGFLYSLSTVADFMLTGSEQARDNAVRAAEILIGRFNENGRFIQAWNENEHSLRQKYTNRGKMIVDCMENLPLLFWATRTTGRDEFAEIAIAHAAATEKHLVRPDFSTGHTFNFDPDTGEPLAVTTAQGYADDSCWSRGQAWAVHGYAYMFRNTGDAHYLELAARLADFAIARLPADGVPIWDFDLPASEPQYRDSSAAAIFAAGFLVLDAEGQGNGKYAAAAARILETLAGDYALVDRPEAEGLLLHGASHVAHDRADNMLPYGDYFYLEALARQDGFDRFFW